MDLPSLGGEALIELEVGIKLPGETCGVDERNERFGPVRVPGTEQESEIDAAPRIDGGIQRFLWMRCELSEPVRRERTRHSAWLSVLDYPVGESDRALALVDREVGAVLHAHYPV
jgi:hypothetical protein